MLLLLKDTVACFPIHKNSIEIHTPDSIRPCFLNDSTDVLIQLILSL